MVLGILCLCSDFSVVVFPDGHHLEECGGCAQSIDCLSIDSILSHLALRLGQCLEGKLFAVGACDGVIDQGLLARVLGFCLLEFLHEIGRVGSAFRIGRVQAAGDDFLNHIESQPVGHDGLDALELGGALGRLSELQLLELGWSDIGHGCGYAIVLSIRRGC